MTEQSESVREKLVKAYDRMMEYLHEIMERGEGGAENLTQALHEARDRVADLDDVTREEAEKVADYLKRDLRQAGSYMDQSGHDMADWLHMDMELIEWSLIDLFMQAADNTKLQLLLLEENAKHVDEYRSGEITGPGVLVCDNCGEELHFNKSGHIPPCPKCQASRFTRKHSK
jgi:flagellar hook-basal body complex protein FliE